ncbi:hypothetical protein CONCODRAFT_19826 [Conidiobolus coronatus NRRL 28638]|uniref:RNI-like protein n=1 Tax=Conidiobolus coronatus (strain ATCC 28846 / CBS 209.66 / NRRL 28638) TaxID=796925 RepID=A0A137NWW0_CONC2|nr:hypothetical protein CONCODRAFT_19826 [Conidiobolus coronatus NRRL 28638]|eukprot:KXN67129.1 hypothetical protein CONCODRAFT_19826 [Conidiobolus coronatus NRRL 28638]
MNNVFDGDDAENGNDGVNEEDELSEGNNTEDDETESENYSDEDEFSSCDDESANDENELGITRKKSVNHSTLYSNQNLLKFKSKIQRYPYKLKIVKALDIIDNGFILELSSKFLNLKHLQISLASISLEDLALSLSKLNSLESFYLQECAIYKSEDTESSELKLPNSLKSLFVHNCEEVGKDLRLDPIKISQQYFELETDAFDLNAQHLPQLEEFSYNQEHFEPTIINQFLALNPQIKSLDIVSESLTNDCLQLLSQSNQIKHLEIEFHDISQSEFDSFTFPPLNSLQSFSVRIAELPSLPIIKLIGERMPNLMELSIDYDPSIEQLLNTLLQNFPKLQTLILLGGDYLEEFSYSIPLHLTNLECIQLPKLDYILLDLEKYEKLKLIKIPFNEEYCDAINQEEFKGWKIISYEKYVHFYKV